MRSQQDHGWYLRRNWKLWNKRVYSHFGSFNIIRKKNFASIFYHKIRTQVQVCDAEGGGVTAREGLLG